LRDKLGPDVGETPLLMLPGFEFVFLSSWRTVSRDSEGASPKATASSASNRNVQRSRPAGAGLQVTAMRWAAPLPVSRGGAPVRGRSVRAPMLSSTKRWRVRSTVTRLVATSSAISSSLSPSSAFNKIRARVICRAAVLPAVATPERVLPTGFCERVRDRRRELRWRGASEGRVSASRTCSRRVEYRWRGAQRQQITPPPRQTSPS